MRDLGSIPGLGRSPGEGKGYPFQYYGLENSLVYGAAKSWTRLSDFHYHLKNIICDGFDDPTHNFLGVVHESMAGGGMGKQLGRALIWICISSH